MKKVICINDKNLPDGANIKKDNEYIVEKEYLNALDQRVYIIQGVTNEGRTRLGMKWIGYNADRFRIIEDTKVEAYEYAYALN